MGGLFQQSRAILKPEPSLELLIALSQPDDTRSPHEAFPPVCIVAGGPAIAEPDAMQAAGEVVHMIMSAKVPATSPISTIAVKSPELSTGAQTCSNLWP